MKARLAIDLSITAAFTVLTLVTVFWPDWIEFMTGLAPDQGSGQLERIIVAIFATFTGLALMKSLRNLSGPRPGNVVGPSVRPEG